MKKTIYIKLSLIVMTFILTFASLEVKAESVTVLSPGTLSTLLSESANEATIKGSINGTDVKYLRQLINEGNLISIDLSETNFVSGGVSYYENFTTKDGILSESMFTNCSNLKSIVLPTTIRKIEKNFCSNTGLTEIVIPDNISNLGMDAFAYCKNLNKVVIGKRVSKLEQGVFWSSGVKDVFVNSMYLPSIAMYEFSSYPNIHVQESLYADFQETSWKEIGSLIGDISSDEIDQDAESNKAFVDYFEDDACTILKSGYANMSDAELKASMKSTNISDVLVGVALKVKNNTWNPYEKDFRIHSYNAYSDANFWHEKLRMGSGSYMGNPTGIYSATDDTIYVFVDQDIPSEASLYFDGETRNNLIDRAKTGIKLHKGLNKIYGEKDATYYVLYTANTSSMTKRVSEWPNITIHIEGGVVNGYYDIARHSVADYQALLKNATYDKFTVKGQYTATNFNTSTYRSVWPESIDRSIARFDSLVLWVRMLTGITDVVYNGYYAKAPFNLTGGESLFPSYFNNLHWAIEDTIYNPGVPADATTYRTAYFSPENVDLYINVDNKWFDAWCVAHEFGHTNQKAISLEKCTEVSNNLFSNMIYLLEGRSVSNGFPLSRTISDYVNHSSYVERDIMSMTRMYYQLYLYYHQAQRNTSFYPTLFKELREDPLELWNNTDESMLKFVRKVCEVANEDLTDFFKAWGFFEPVDTDVSDYGDYHVTVKQADIDATLEAISKYPKKNRQILFIEDRVKPMETTDYLTTPGQNRLDPELYVGHCGDLGQYTDYLPNEKTVPSYVYEQYASQFVLEGEGGVGFIVLDIKGDLLFASNNKSFELPSYILNQKYSIKAVDADGNLYDVKKKGEKEDPKEPVESNSSCDKLLKNVEVMAWGGTLVDVSIFDKKGEEISFKFYDENNNLQAAYPDYQETQLMNGPIGSDEAYVHHLCLYQTANLSFNQEYSFTAKVGERNCEAKFSLAKGIYDAKADHNYEEEGILNVVAERGKLYIEFMSNSDTNALVNCLTTIGSKIDNMDISLVKGYNYLTLESPYIYSNGGYVLSIIKEGKQFSKTFIAK